MSIVIGLLQPFCFIIFYGPPNAGTAKIAIIASETTIVIIGTANADTAKDAVERPHGMHTFLRYSLFSCSLPHLSCATCSLMIAAALAVALSGCTPATQPSTPVPTTSVLAYVSTISSAPNSTIPCQLADTVDLNDNPVYSRYAGKIAGIKLERTEGWIGRLTRPQFTSGFASDQILSFVKVVVQFHPEYGDNKSYELAHLYSVPIATFLADNCAEMTQLQASPEAPSIVSLFKSRPRFTIHVLCGDLNTGPATVNFISTEINLLLTLEVETPL